jgi:SAM-dependent methyltransferase
MANAAKPDERAGWEMIWRRGDDHPRYGVCAGPNPAVVEWAETVPAQGFVLDLGCGVGRHVVYLAERGFRMAGLDVSPSGIRLTQEACLVREFQFEGRVSDMSALPWSDQTFDAVLSISAIHHHQRQEIQRTLGEVRRVLKPGGLLLADFPCTHTTDYCLMRTQVCAGQIDEVEPNTFVDRRSGLEDTDDGFLPHHYCDEADLRDLLSSFEIIRLGTSLLESKDGLATRGKWIASARRPGALPRHGDRR